MTGAVLIRKVTAVPIAKTPVDVVNPIIKNFDRIVRRAVTGILLDPNPEKPAGLEVVILNDQVSCLESVDR